MKISRKHTSSKYGRGSDVNWLLTYSDMLTLLLVFFLLLMANTVEFKEENQIKFILSVFNNNVGFLIGGHTLTKDEFHAMSANIEALPSDSKANELNNFQNQVNDLFSDFIKSKRVRVDSNEKGLSISLLADFFFKKDDTGFDARSNTKILERIKYFLHYLDINQTGYRVEIQGHTDQDESRESNDLEVSFYRAKSIFEAIANVDHENNKWGRKNISLHAYGDTSPVSFSGIPEEKASNRRVTIKFIWE